jgi:hypothetical protein
MSKTYGHATEITMHNIPELINQDVFECHFDAYVFRIDESPFMCKYYINHTKRPLFFWNVTQSNL